MQVFQLEIAPNTMGVKKSFNKISIKPTRPQWKWFFDNAYRTSSKNTIHLGYFMGTQKTRTQKKINKKSSMKVDRDVWIFTNVFYMAKFFLSAEQIFVICGI